MAMQREYDYLFKVILIGDAGVVKASILGHLTESTSAGIPTIGVEFVVKTLQIGSSTVKLQIWDTAGQERFRTITSSYYRSANAIVLVYDIGLPDSFRSLPKWLSEVEKYAESNVQKFLIGNKTDNWPNRMISSEQGQQFSQENNMPFLEVSTKNSENIDELFLQLATTLRDAHVDKMPQHGSAGVCSVDQSEAKAEGGGRCY